MEHWHKIRKTGSKFNVMKQIAKKCSVLVVVCVFALFSFAEAQNLDDISFSIKTGNSKELAKKLDSSVEITILNKEATYSKAQAEMVLKNFFSKHTPKPFKIIHTGNSQEGSKYGIGKLVTGNGTFRTYVYAKQRANDFYIQEIRFEEE